MIDIIPNEPYARYITTKSREAENIIPTKVLDHFAKKNKVLKNNIDKIKMLIDDKNIDSSPTKFIDFKKGVRRQLIKTTCPDTNLFWGDAFKKAGLVKVCNQKTGCTSVKTCCCSLIDGLGTDLLKCTVKHLKENKLDFNDVDDYLKPEWVFLCESIIPYIVSPLRKSS
ncbi:hypothetical protein FM037_16420 [Shewanella psychropiezotolerans]|uniref:Uncharacterized protein n=1 Tax=Shewanella psychropiezotolerans TaxID=2593655 RepID=A0ABX5WZG4_9GAMM|nr:hypothetical protein [Shewanella psychropiezotolerans]QDO84500.1 hypothetical protein FM037_16420 [Shewanella psychropiezotolerans]